MRVLNRKDFLAMPAGTIYAKGGIWHFETLHIKGETNNPGIDWWFLNMCWVESEHTEEAITRLEDMLNNGASYPAEDAYTRDGDFDEDTLFLVFEHADLVVLKNHVEQALALAKNADPAAAPVSDPDEKVQAVIAAARALATIGPQISVAHFAKHEALRRVIAELDRKP